jgi:spore coat protein U-like protein
MQSEKMFNSKAKKHLNKPVSLVLYFPIDCPGKPARRLRKAEGGRRRRDSNMAKAPTFKSALGATSLVALTALAAPATAQDTSNLLVQANVGGSCVLGDVTSANNDVTLDFGIFDGQDTLGTATIDYSCTAATNIGIGLGGGSNPSGTDRIMLGSNGGSLLYSLYKDSNHSDVWGEDASTEVDVPDATTGNVTVFGLIPQQSVPPAGVFTDTVLITLTTN